MEVDFLANRALALPLTGVRDRPEVEDRGGARLWRRAKFRKGQDRELQGKLQSQHAARPGKWALTRVLAFVIAIEPKKDFRFTSRGGANSEGR